MSSKSDLEISLERFTQKCEEIIRLLNNKIKEIEEHRKGCNIAKTVGTSLSGAGTLMTIGGIIATPITAGLSLTLTVGGLSMTGVGAATNLTTNIVDIVISKDFMKKIQMRAHEYNNLACELQIKIEKVLEVVNHLQSSGIGESEAFIIAFRGVATNAFSVGKGVWDAALAAKSVMKAARYAKAINSVGIGMSVTFGKTAAQMSKAEQEAVGAFIKTTGASISGSVGKSVLKSVGVVIGVGLTVVDVALTIRDWNTKHPTIKVINDLIKDIKSGKEKANLILNIMIKK